MTHIHAYTDGWGKIKAKAKKQNPFIGIACFNHAVSETRANMMPETNVRKEPSLVVFTMHQTFRSSAAASFFKDISN